MKRFLIALMALAAFATACSGGTDVFSLSVGDCFDEIGGDEIESVDSQACDEAHIYEIFHAFDIAGDDYPGSESVVSQAQDGCLAEFEAFVGRSYNDSALDISYLYPTDESWDQADDREVLCMVVNVDQSPRTGSAAGSDL